MTARNSCLKRQRGVGLIEILVTLVLLMVGLLGLVGVMVQSQRAQLESYERVQALLLAQDMVGRLSSNRAAASCYAITAATGDAPSLGTGSAVAPTCGVGTASQQATALADLAEWSALLTGAAEVSSGNNVGAVLGARGCIHAVSPNVYQVSVAWQGGSANASSPPDTMPCGKDLYGADTQRRVVSLRVQIVLLS